MREHKTRERRVLLRQIAAPAVRALGLVPGVRVVQLTLRVLLVIGLMVARLLRWVRIIIVLRMPVVA